MAVPDTTTFNLQNVVDEVNPTTDDLVDCFSDAIAANFDPAYEGSKNSLLNFRNYGAVTYAINGFLYNWYAASNANFAPAGWRVPTKADFEALALHLDASAVWNFNTAGGKMKETGLTRWSSPNTGATNSSGFSAFGSGQREAGVGFNSLLGNAFFWTKESFSTSGAIGQLSSANGIFGYVKDGEGGFTAEYKDGLSIRLIKNDSVNPGTITDIDGNPYDCVTIGSQIWTKQNWKSTRLANGTSIPLVTSDPSWDALTTLARCAYDNDVNNV